MFNSKIKNPARLDVSPQGTIHQKSKIKNQKSKIILCLLLVLTVSISPVFAQDMPDPPESDPASGIQSPKSKRTAVLLSLAVPGLGEAYAGTWGRARIFFAAEAVTWAGFTAFRVYGNWRANDYRVFATEHAGVLLGGQPDSYFRDIGAFINSDVYNLQQQLEQRDRARLYTGSDTWAWNSDASREAYLDIRRSSRHAHVRSIYIIGFALVTRLISAIDAGKMVDARYPHTEERPALNLYTPQDGSVWLIARIPF